MIALTWFWILRYHLHPHSFIESSAGSIETWIIFAMGSTSVMDLYPNTAVGFTGITYPNPYIVR